MNMKVRVWAPPTLLLAAVKFRSSDLVGAPKPGFPRLMAELVPASSAPNQVQDVVNVAPALAVSVPEPVLAAPVAQVENRLPAGVDNVAQNAAPEATIPNLLIPSLFQLV